MARLPQDYIAICTREQLIRLEIEGWSYKVIHEALVDYMNKDEEIETEEIRALLSAEHRA